MKVYLHNIFLQSCIKEAIDYYNPKMIKHRNFLINQIVDYLNEYHRNYFESFWYRLKRLFGGYIKYKKYTFDDLLSFCLSEDCFNKESIDIRDLLLVPISLGNFTYSFYQNKTVYHYNQIIKRLKRMQKMLERHAIDSFIEINDEEFGLIFHD